MGRWCSWSARMPEEHEVRVRFSADPPEKVKLNCLNKS